MRWTMKGWSFAEFVKGNKELLKIVAGGLTALATSGSLSPTWAIVAGVAVKGLLDIVHYYAAE